jgi:hypothetical protein
MPARKGEIFVSILDDIECRGSAYAQHGGDAAIQPIIDEVVLINMTSDGNRGDTDN